VKLVLKFDRRRTMKFAPLDSAAGKALLEAHPELQKVDSIALIEGARASIRSTAVLRVLSYLGWPWKVFLVGYLIPREIRDSLYDVVAYWRYRIFGKYQSCPIPPPEVRSRFL
jgi:predicted DCC family thiol-disulfide oxidoreductase YuxK